MQLSSKNILVTGGAGFIGSHLADSLSDCSIRILDDFSTGSEANVEHLKVRSGVEIVRGDIRCAADVAAAVSGVDVVFHLACRGVRHSIGNPRENHEVNATGTLILLEAARAAGVERFVHVSSSEVYGTARYVPMDEEHPCFPETVYGAAKLAGECYARAYYRTYEFPTIVVRPFNNFGPRSHYEGDSGEVIPRFAVWALNGMPPVIFGDGTQTRDFIFVEDTAYWLRRVAECDELIGRTVNLGSGKETSVRDLVGMVWEAAGTAAPQPRFMPRRPGDVDRHLAAVGLAERVLGFRTRTSMREGIGKLISHLRNRADDASALLARTQDVNWTVCQTASPLAAS